MIHRMYRPAPMALYMYDHERRYDEDVERRHIDGRPAVRRVVRNAVRAPPVQNLPQSKAPLYDGTSSWTDYLIQFELVGELNGWNEPTMAMYLATSLRGTAQSVLGDLDEGSRRDYGALVAILNQRFGPEHQTEMFRALLRNRTRQMNESLPDLAHEIRRLVKLAYPTGQHAILEDLAKNHFIDALSEPESRWQVQQTRPRNLDEAVRVAVELEAFHMAEKHRNPSKKSARVVKFRGDEEEGTFKNGGSTKPKNVQDDPVTQLQELFETKLKIFEDRISNMVQTAKQNPNNIEQKRDVRCFHCGEAGHIRPMCEKFREEKEARFRRSQGAAARRRGNQGN